MATPAAIVFASALIVSLLLTVLVRRLAPRIGLIDRPDGHRKLHGKVTPLGGGAAVFLATTTVLVALFAIPNPWRGAFDWSPADLVALLLASAVVVLVGLVDDRVRLRGRQKLVGQVLAASILIANDLVIERIAVFGWQIDLGLLAIPLTYFWFIGAINSLNLLDGIDGLATMLGIILVGTFAALAVMVGRPEVAVIALAFAGALCGFMRFNFPPASIFLGDAGSMLIGLVVGTLAIHGSLKGPGTVLLAVPLAVWTLPILDSAAAILRRKLTGRSIYSTDRGHLHHRLMERLGSNRKVLALVAVCSVATSGAALASVSLKADLVAVLVCAAVVVVLAVTGFFGRAESALIWKRISDLGRSLSPVTAEDRGTSSEDTVRLQGSREWDILWKMLTESAEKLHLRKIHLDLNLPMLHEGFNATWESHDPQNPEMHWQVDIPLVVNCCPAGRLTVVGERNGVPAAHDIECVLEVVDSIEAELPVFVERMTTPHFQKEQTQTTKAVCSAETDSTDEPVQVGAGTSA
jgi:UDP-GlcNAc:undecaprenyl-phosphate GlcNAc-1-phosphate transferase